MAKYLDPTGVNLLWAKFKSKLSEITNTLTTKANISDLPNVIAEDVLDGSTIEGIDILTIDTALSSTSTNPVQNKVINEAIEKAKYALLIDMWNRAWNLNNFGVQDNDYIYGKYDPDNAPDAEHPFMGNKIWMTYEEAILVLHESIPFSNNITSLYNHKYPKSKTLLPITTFGNSENFNSTFQYCKNLEAIAIRSGYGNTTSVSSLNNTFWGCENLKEVYGIIDLHQTTATQTPADRCKNLEGIYFRNLKYGLSIGYSPNLRLDCIKYWIDNAINTTEITITVHPNIYEKMTKIAAAGGDKDDTETDDDNMWDRSATIIYAYPEWRQVFEDAAARNIVFVAAEQTAVNSLEEIDYI